MLDRSLVNEQRLFWLMISHVLFMGVWLSWQWACVAEESYLSLGRDHTTVVYVPHPCLPTKFPQPPKAVPPAEEQSFTAGVCGRYFKSKTSQTVMHPC